MRYLALILIGLTLPVTAEAKSRRPIPLYADKSECHSWKRIKGRLACIDKPRRTRVYRDTKYIPRILPRVNKRQIRPRINFRARVLDRRTVRQRKRDALRHFNPHKEDVKARIRQKQIEYNQSRIRN